MKLSLTRVLAVIGAALVLMIGGAFAYASIPSADGTITACMVKPAGTIRLIDTATEPNCRKGETKVAWNQAGQPGTNGTNGVSGYEVVTVTGITSISTSNTIGFSHNGSCPAGKKMLGSFASGFIVPDHPGGNGILNAAWSNLFTSQGRDFVTIEFTTGTGDDFDPGDEAHWEISVTCATVN